MTHNGIREQAAAAEGGGHKSHRLAMLIGMLVAFSTMFVHGAAAQEQRGLRSNTPEASPGYVIFNSERMTAGRPNSRKTLMNTGLASSIDVE